MCLLEVGSSKSLEETSKLFNILKKRDILDNWEEGKTIKVKNQSINSIYRLLFNKKFTKLFTEKILQLLVPLKVTRFSSSHPAIPTSLGGGKVGEAYMLRISLSGEEKGRIKYFK